jgi:hypothetical protein
VIWDLRASKKKRIIKKLVVTSCVTARASFDDDRNRLQIQNEARLLVEIDGYSDAFFFIMSTICGIFAMASFAIAMRASLTSTSMVILTFPLILSYHLLQVVLIEEQVDLNGVMVSVSTLCLDEIITESPILLIGRKFAIDIDTYDIREESFKSK